MQKTVRINLQARKNLLKQTRKSKIQAAKSEWSDYHLQKQAQERKARQYVKEERANRREDWILGPLAPNRNVGTNKGTFGTVDVELAQSPDIPRPVQATPRRPGSYASDYKGQDKRLAFTGDTIVGNVVAGDRVVVVHGPDRIKGTIGTVQSVDRRKEELKIENVNMADVRVPPTALQREGSEATLYNSQEMPIPITHVRLVATMKKDDGTVADVIVRHVHAGAPYGQRAIGSGTPAHTRYATGSGQNQEDGRDIPIPWPPADSRSNLTHAECDTVRTDVQETTWLPVVTAEPLGYTFDVDENKQVSAQAATPYTLGLVDRQNADNIQRAGLHGFISESKLNERRTRIARGILDELRPRDRRATVFHEDNAWVKRKMLEDARAIWWRDRKLLSPAAEAAERAQQERQRQREEQISKSTGMPAPAVREGGMQASITLQPMSLPAETIDLVKTMQAASLKTAYKTPDPKFRKRLEHMERARLDRMEAMEKMAVEA